MIEITNEKFLSALFGEDTPNVHVTDFKYDPGNIPKEQQLLSWKGDYFNRYQFGQQTNQYFTISNFRVDNNNIARRQKVLYRHTPVIVLDDVREKLSIDQVLKLPSPTWILETSEGSEQWGYLLTKPCTDRARVENLLDGLVANGLAPDGKDPGMKGVTRYVRLPDGVNSKASKLVNNQPFKCRLLEWSPFSMTTLEDLAAPFHVNLEAVRREARVDGAAKIDDHPLLALPDLITIKDVRSEGRFDISCPWKDEHTNEEDSGSAVFTNADGTIGFKCHHGACQERTGFHLLQFMEEHSPGFGEQFKNWQIKRIFNDIASPSPGPSPSPAPTPLTSTDTKPVENTDDALKDVFNNLKSISPFSSEARDIAGKMLQIVDVMSPMEKVHWHNEIREVMKWNKNEFSTIIAGLREQWYLSKKSQINFFDDVIFIAEQNHFFDRKKNIFYTPEAYQNCYSHLEPEARSEALQGGMVTKVDKLDYAPLSPPVFTERGIVYGNSWSNVTEVHGTPGDVSRYLDHFDAMGWGKNRDHILKWIAYTIRHPDKKINHILLMGSPEGCGKDWILYPLVLAMGDNHMTVDGEELIRDFDDYILTTKHLHINEAELGDRKEAQAVSARLKPLAAAPPDRLRVNQKGIKPIRVRNILNCSMTTNSQMPLRLSGPSRRFYAVWSDLNVRDEDDNMTPEWNEYWQDRWNWMKNGGAEACIDYLKNVVDLSDFNPGAAPPVTEFLRDIRESSKSPMQQTIEAFINHRLGCFAADITTASDMVQTLKASTFKEDYMALMYAEPHVFTPVKVGVVVRDITGCSRRRATSGTSGSVRLIILRNSEKYTSLSMTELYREYERQLISARQAAPLTVVK